MNKTIEAISKQTDKIILFHSGTGKDSIALLDMCAPHFAKIHCVFMYYVPNLKYESAYIDWALHNYSNTEFIKIPHFAVYSFLRAGYLGIKKSDVPNKSLSDIVKVVKRNIGIQYALFGFKKIDSIDRRIMLNDIEDKKYMHEGTKNCYPLAEYKNKDVLQYIEQNNLIPPFAYTNTKPSSGCDISDPLFLSYIKSKNNYDYEKIIATYPHCESILFRYENKTK